MSYTGNSSGSKSSIKSKLPNPEHDVIVLHPPVDVFGDTNDEIPVRESENGEKTDESCNSNNNKLQDAYLSEIDDLNELYKIQKELERKTQILNLSLKQKEREVDEMKSAAKVEIGIYKKRIAYLEKKLPTVPQTIDKENLKSEHSSNLLLSEISDEELENLMQSKIKEYETKLKILRNELEAEKINQVANANKQAVEDIDLIESKHQIELNELRQFYSNLTNEHLKKLSEAKTRVKKSQIDYKETKKIIDEMEKNINEVKSETDKLTKENDEISKEIDSLKESKDQLNAANEKLQRLQDEKDNQILALSILSERFEELEEERNALYDQFEASIQDVRQKADFRAAILDFNMKSLNQGLDEKEILLSSTLRRTGLDESAIAREIQDVVSEKNTKILFLEKKLAAMEAKMKLYEGNQN